jgi:hypothetical protein
MELTPEEYGIVTNSRFLLVKADVIAKVRAEFEQLQVEYLAILKQKEISLPPFAQPKISRGENYKGLPYLVLDYPAVFDKENILAFRTMFWWGNFFSITLHLQGTYKEQYLESIKGALYDKKPKGLYISCNTTAWEYHYGENNYLTVDSLDNSTISSLLNKNEFIKLSAKLDLADYAQLQGFMREWFGVMVGLIK